MSAKAVIDELKSKANPVAVAGMARFGISAHNTLGVSMPTLRATARKLGRTTD